MNELYSASVPVRAHTLMAAVALASLVLAPCALAQHHLYTFNGDSAGDFFGYSVSAAGDVNKDGHSDLIVGAHRDSNNGRRFSGSARVLSGKDGAILYTFNGDSAGDRFGYSVSGAGDVNKDGYADLIVGAYLDSNNGRYSGSARVFSGKDGAVLYTFNGDSAGDALGISVSGAGDVNKDGYADLIVGAYTDDNNGGNSGSARVFSGKDGAILYTWSGDSAGDFMGISVSGAGDVNKDGFADLIVGANGDDNNGSNSGSARVFSGKDGTTLYTFNGDSVGDFFGCYVSDGGDVNKDGFADLIVGAPLDDNRGTNAGSARVHSGKDGAILYTFDGDSAGDQFGVSVSGAGDVNKDGYADLIVGAYLDDNNGLNSGSARVFSGKNGAILFTFNGDSAGDFFGSFVSDVGDVNKDGHADLVVGAYYDDNNGSSSGSARVLSSKPLTLTADTHSVSLARRGTQSLSLFAGPKHAGKLYVVLGSMTGTKPGIPLARGITLPLNLDAYMTLVLGSPNSMIVPSVGLLDQLGKATARLTLPPLDPQLAGTALHHAYVVIDMKTLSFRLASNPVPLTLVK